MTRPTTPVSPIAGARGALRPALARAATSVVILALLLWWLPLPILAAAIGRVSLALWLGIVAGFLVCQAVSVFKWRLLVRAAGVPLSAPLAFRAHALGLFANLCLPSVVGGDLVRAGLIVREHGHAEAVAFASLGDRVNDSLALVLLAGVGALACGNLGRNLPLRLLLGFVFLLPAAVAGAALVVWRIPAARLPNPLARAAGRLREVQASLLARWRVVARAFVLSLAIQATFVALNLPLASAVGIEQPAAVWLLVWPLAKLAALLPISLGGIGVREVALAGLLAPFGVAPAAAVAQSLCWQVVLVGSGLAAGAAALALGKRMALSRRTEGIR